VEIRARLKSCRAGLPFGSRRISGTSYRRPANLPSRDLQENGRSPATCFPKSRNFGKETCPTTEGWLYCRKGFLPPQREPSGSRCDLRRNSGGCGVLAGTTRVGTASRAPTRLASHNLRMNLRPQERQEWAFAAHCCVPGHIPLLASARPGSRPVTTYRGRHLRE
jgi:hypothetical protein